ncbi:hypothetical protein BB8028_0002g05680 [Beauveria bassiana]|uniref:Uncharacterized protein n=1 Tax=Beauveria bassiana TaxID=176275 RepID=A0A2S7Y2G5_BEABA|nr:hypothetical protein BB8028_0002g05680 [Beauveria bassiana]
MARARFAAVTRRIREEKSLKYIGAAAIRLDHLFFPNSEGPDHKNVKRLVKLFQGQHGCSPGETQNRIPAIISEPELQDALAISKLSREELVASGDRFARLNFPAGFRLECLRGEDRVRAASEALNSPEPRWVVDLYAADISGEAKRDLAEEYASEKTPADGEFYYKIREYQGVFGQENSRCENTWKARLGATSDSGHKKNRLDQILTDPRFCVAFDAFHHLPVLYGDLKLSLVNKMTSMGCHEESLHYLKHIKDFWYSVFDGNESAMRKFDRSSLEALQLMAPGACEKQARDLHARIRSGEILGAFAEAERERLWIKIFNATVDYRVPSLHSFFEDRKYLEDAAHCIKRLLSVERHKTIRPALELAYPDVDEQSPECLVQVSGSSFKWVATDGADHFDLAYRQLWLYARRHFEDMPPEREQIVAGHKTAEVDEMVLFDFASFAHKLGFRTTEIEKLLQGNPDRQIARRLLMTARKPELFHFDDIESSISAVTDVMKAARPIRNGQALDEDEHEVVADGKTAKQCGRPLVSDHTRDKPFMFLDKLHTSIPRQNTKLSSFFIQRSIYFAFFGKDILISCDAMQTAPEVQGVYDISMDIEPTSETPVRPPQARAQTEIDQRGMEYQTKLRNVQSEAADAESRLESLLAKEQHQREQLAGLEDAIAARAADSAAMQKELQDKVDSLKQREVGQVIRLESLAANEQEELARIKQLEQSGADLGGEIQLDRIATYLEAPTEDEIAGGTERLLQVSAQLSEKQNEVNRLEEMERHKRLVIGQLEEEEARLRSSIDDLAVRVRRLTADEQAKATSIAAMEKQHQSTNNKLVEKELGLRQTIDFLEVCRERLEGQIKAATEKAATEKAATEEKELLSRAGLGGEVTSNPAGEGSMDDEDALQVTERGQSFADDISSVSVEGSEVEKELNGAVRLEHLIRNAFDSKEDHPAVTEDTPLPLFSRSLPVASDSQLGVPMGDQAEKIIQARSAASTEPEEGGKVRIAFKILDKGKWIVDREVVVDAEDPSEVQRSAIKYLQRDMGIFSNKNRVLTAETCFERVRSNGTNAIYVVPQWAVETSRPWGGERPAKRTKIK